MHRRRQAGQGRRQKLILFAALAFGTLSALARAEPTPRSPRTVVLFKRLHPCPATDLPRGPCPGWIVDHVIPLCARGKDDPSNMQWQRRADALAKDRTERAACRALRSIEQ